MSSDIAVDMHERLKVTTHPLNARKGGLPMQLLGVGLVVPVPCRIYIRHTQRIATPPRLAPAHHTMAHSGHPRTTRWRMRMCDLHSIRFARSVVAQLAVRVVAARVAARWRARMKRICGSTCT